MKKKEKKTERRKRWYFLMLTCKEDDEVLNATHFNTNRAAMGLMISWLLKSSEYIGTRYLILSHNCYHTMTFSQFSIYSIYHIVSVWLVVGMRLSLRIFVGLHWRSSSFRIIQYCFIIMFVIEYQNMVLTHDRPIMINVFISRPCQDFSPQGWNWQQSNGPTLNFYQLP